MSTKILVIVFTILLGLMLSACAPAGNQPGALTTGLPTDLPAAAMEAQQFLSESLGVEVSDVQIVSVEQVQWPDACLGLPQGDEACAEVVTPGFNITLDVNGQTYEVHTDEQGVGIRQAP